MSDTHWAARRRRAAIRTTAPVIAVLVVALAGCGATDASGGSDPASEAAGLPEQTTTQPTSPHAADAPDGDPARDAAVYITVLRRYLDTELSVGGPHDVGTVYVLTRAGQDQGPPDGTVTRIPRQVQRSVSAALGDRYRLRWVDDAGSVELSGRGVCDPAGKRDVLIALGRVPDGTEFQLTLDGRSDCGLAGGWVYRVAADDGSWTVKSRRASWQA